MEVSRCLHAERARWSPESCLLAEDHWRSACSALQLSWKPPSSPQQSARGSAAPKRRVELHDPRPCRGRAFLIEMSLLWCCPRRQGPSQRVSTLTGHLVLWACQRPMLRSHCSCQPEVRSSLAPAVGPRSSPARSPPFSCTSCWSALSALLTINHRFLSTSTGLLILVSPLLRAAAVPRFTSYDVA